MSFLKDRKKGKQINLMNTFADKIDMESVTTADVDLNTDSPLQVKQS